MFAHNASAFDSWVVLNSLVKEITEWRITKTAKRLISISFRCGVKINITVEVLQNVKFTCTKSQIEVSLVKIGREYGLQPGPPERKIKHSVNNKSIFADLRQTWEPYLKLDVSF